MTTVKSYTDLSQSKKLAEILPHESADMVYVHTVDLEGDEHYDIDFRNNQPLFEDDISAWSLAALLSVLPTIDDEFEPQLHRSLDKYRCTYEGEEDSSGLWRVADNPVDACYEMILKLHELKML